MGCLSWGVCWKAINTLRPRQNGRHFTDNILKCIFLNENIWISIKISLKFVPKGPINNIPALVRIMAWHQSGDKPLSEPMVVSLLTHICVTRPEWVNRYQKCIVLCLIMAKGYNELGLLSVHWTTSLGCLCLWASTWRVKEWWNAILTLLLLQPGYLWRNSSLL